MRQTTLEAFQLKEQAAHVYVYQQTSGKALNRMFLDNYTYTYTNQRAYSAKGKYIWYQSVNIDMLQETSQQEGSFKNQ